jgi:multimeric flavodoxin WrbA
MKVVAFNGSPHKEGNTWFALRTMAEELEKEGIEVEIIQVGDKAIRGCIDCGSCARNKDEKCVLAGDEVNYWVRKIKEADGVILGSPVHFSAIGGAMKSFLDRAFIVAASNDSLFRHKVGAAAVSVRRSGGVAAFTQLNNYLYYAEMLMPTSTYWSVIHGNEEGEAQKDGEGVQIMSNLGRNMAWLLKLVEFGKGNVAEPARVERVRTNFVRE